MLLVLRMSLVEQRSGVRAAACWCAVLATLYLGCAPVRHVIVEESSIEDICLEDSTENIGSLTSQRSQNGGRTKEGLGASAAAGGARSRHLSGLHGVRGAGPGCGGVRGSGA